VIPVYKCSGNLIELSNRLLKIVSELTKTFEIIYVVDGSPDESWSVITSLASSNEQIKALKLSRNFGQHYAVTAGLDYTKGDWIVIMDCDLQDQPEEIPKLYNKILEGYDVVLARRGKREDTFFKKLSNYLFYKVFNFLSGMKYDPQVGAFRIISKKVVNNFRLMKEQTRFFNGLMEWMGFSTAYVDVTHGERFSGETSYTFFKLLRFSIDIIIAHSDKPLRISIFIGFFMSFLSMIYGLYILSVSLTDGIAVSGWSSLMISMYFLAGVIMMNLGILGVYLGKVFSQTKGRPLYFVDKVIGFSE